MIRELVAEGTTVLLTTQYLEEADRLADRIAVVDGGRVIANDTPERLKAQLGSTVVEMDFRGEGRAERALQVLSARIEDHVEREGERVRITSERGAAVLIEALRALDEQDMAPDTLTVREPSMDDVFLALTGRHAESQDDETATTTGDAA
jgi:ABC-type multidrug transport system ATPase subunit